MAYTYPVAPVQSKYLVTLVGELAGQRIMSTFWYRLKTLVGTPTHGDVCTGLLTRLTDANQLVDKYLLCCPGNYTMVEQWCQPIDIFRYAKFVVPVSAAGTSTYAADTANVDQVILRRGVEANRRSISRLHVPSPTTEDWFTAGLLTVAAKGALQTLANEVIEERTLAGGSIMQPCIRNGVLDTQYKAIEDALAQDTVRVMTRRTVRRGI